MLPASTGGVHSYGYACMYQNLGIKMNKFAGSAQNAYKIMQKDDLMCRKRVRI